MSTGPLFNQTPHWRHHMNGARRHEVANDSRGFNKRCSRYRKTTVGYERAHIVQCRETHPPKVLPGGWNSLFELGGKFDSSLCHTGVGWRVFRWLIAFFFSLSVWVLWLSGFLGCRVVLRYAVATFGWACRTDVEAFSETWLLDLRNTLREFTRRGGCALQTEKIHPEA